MATETWITVLIRHGVPLLVQLIRYLLEYNSKKRKLKREALQEVLDGIKNKDTSKITAGFDRLNNI